MQELPGFWKIRCERAKYILKYINIIAFINIYYAVVYASDLKEK